MGDVVDVDQYGTNMPHYGSEAGAVPHESPASFTRSEHVEYNTAGQQISHRLRVRQRPIYRTYAGVTLAIQALISFLVLLVSFTILLLYYLDVAEHVDSGPYFGFIGGVIGWWMNGASRELIANSVENQRHNQNQNTRFDPQAQFSSSSIDHVQ